MWVNFNRSLAVFNPFEVQPMDSVPNACFNISNVSEKAFSHRKQNLKEKKHMLLMKIGHI